MKLEDLLDIFLKEIMRIDNKSKNIAAKLFWAPIYFFQPLNQNPF